MVSGTVLVLITVCIVSFDLLFSGQGLCPDLWRIAQAVVVPVKGRHDTRRHEPRGWRCNSTARSREKARQSSTVEM